MNTAPELQNTTSPEYAPLQQNAQGILVGAPPPLATQATAPKPIPARNIEPRYLLTLGIIQLSLSCIFIFVGLPLMRMAHLTLQTTSSQITPFQVSSLNALLALILLGAGLAGKKFVRLEQHWLYPKAAWLLFGTGVLAVFVFTVYILWLLLFP